MNIYNELEGSKGYVLYITGGQVQTPSSENAGAELVSVETWCGKPGEPAHLLDLGVKAMLVDINTKEPVHYWLLPRSSIYKTGHIMANSVGVIDSSYRGVLKAPVVSLSDTAKGFTAGERYFQIVAPDMGQILRVVSVDELPTSQRGDGGFGSTGK
jgi:dUTP pyrophosphatase